MLQIIIICALNKKRNNMCQFFILLLLFASPVYGMNPEDRQLQFCPSRRASYNSKLTVPNQKISEPIIVNKPCVFCDEKIFRKC